MREHMFPIVQVSEVPVFHILQNHLEGQHLVEASHFRLPPLLDLLLPFGFPD
jgi:hypothetical protein